MSRICLGVSLGLTTALLAGTAASAAPVAVAVGPDGTAYSADDATSVVTLVARDGTAGASFGGRGTAAGTFGAITGIDVDKDTGHVWVLDDANRLQELSAAGAPLRSVTLPACTGTPDLLARGGVSVAAGYVFVASSCTDQLLRYDKATLTNPLTASMTAPGGISYDQYASTGYRVAVADPAAKVVRLYTDALVFVKDLPLGYRVTDVELDDYGDVLANDLDTDEIRYYGGGDGALYRTLGGTGTADGRLAGPSDFDQFWNYGDDLSGNLFIADHGNARVQRWSSGGFTFFARTIGAQTPGGGGTTDPGGGGTIDPGGGGTPPGGGGTTPPAGAPAPTSPIGVSIAGGASYVSSPDVTLGIVAPAGTTQVLISDDGGFAHASTVPWSASNLYRHTLSSSGSERLPKTVYVRFAGPFDATRTFTDDVILDQTAPVLTAARASGGTAAPSPRAVTRTARRKAARVRPTVLRLKARDTLSGVRFVEVVSRLGGRSHTLRYKATVGVAGVGPRPYVRAVDAAGNHSRWMRATR